MLFIYLIYCIVGADLGACAAIGAFVLIDDELGISLGDAFNRAFFQAVSAGIALVSDYIGHFLVLTKKVNKRKSIKIVLPWKEGVPYIYILSRCTKSCFPLSDVQELCQNEHISNYLHIFGIRFKQV